MRVLFRAETDWWHLDEAASRVLLDLHDEQQWRAVRSLLFRQRHFTYTMRDAKDAAAAAAQHRHDSGNNNNDDDDDHRHVNAALFERRSVSERIIEQLFATRAVQQAGLTVVQDWRTGRAEVLRMADVVRAQLREQQLRAREQRTTDAAPSLDAYVLAGLKRMKRRGGRNSMT